MVDIQTPSTGPVLLIDAAGPTSIVGLLSGHKWLACTTSEGEFLEWLQPAVSGILEQHRLALADLSSIYYGSGPGSTLGLRLAALFVRTLLEIPQLNDTRCYQYQNLELAICALDGVNTIVAPWRKDRYHLCERGNPAGGFTSSGVSPESAAAKGAAGVILGRRMHRNDHDIEWLPFPVEDIPAALHANPRLLKPTANPVPYSIETPEFAKWNSRRHSAK